MVVIDALTGNGASSTALILQLVACQNCLFFLLALCWVDGHPRWTLSVCSVVSPTHLIEPVDQNGESGS